MLNPWLGYAAARHPEIVATSDFYGQINTVEKSWGCRVIGGLTLFAGYDLTGRMKLGLSYRRNAANLPFTDKTSREGRFYLPFKYQNLSLGLQVYL